MTLLRDTHVFLWWLDDASQLSKAANRAIGDGKNTVYARAAVVWEISIKRRDWASSMPRTISRRRWRRTASFLCQ